MARNLTKLSTTEFLISRGCIHIIPLLDADDVHSIIRFVDNLTTTDLHYYHKNYLHLPLSIFNADEVRGSIIDNVYYEYNKYTHEPSTKINWSKFFIILACFYGIFTSMMLYLIWKI